MRHTDIFDTQRRNLLRLGAFGSVYGLAAPFLGGFAHAREANADKRTLVVLELSGGNDGLNTIVPFGNDDYYRLRPTIGIKPNKLRKLDDQFGLNSGMAGMDRLYKDGRMAIVHGVGYPQPSFSHFNSMAYWHTAAPNSGASYGWVGRLADVLLPEGTKNAIVNIDATQSLAVRSRKHVPVVFDDPNRFVPKGKPMHSGATLDKALINPSQNFLHDVARSAEEASEQVREARSNYKSSTDYCLV